MRGAPGAAPDRARLYRDLKRVALLAPPIVLSLCMANFSGLVDMAFGSLAGSAAPAALDKAFRLMLLPYGVFAVAIGIVALPEPGAAGDGRGGQFDGELMRTVRFLAAILIPVGRRIGLLSDELVGLAYERGGVRRDQPGTDRRRSRGVRVRTSGARAQPRGHAGVDQPAPTVAADRRHVRGPAAERRARRAPDRTARRRGHRDRDGRGARPVGLLLMLTASD